MNLLNQVTHSVQNIVKNTAEELKVDLGKVDPVKQISKQKLDKLLSIMQLVKSYGYPIERHQYTTEDGYMNTAFRINGPRGTHAREVNNSGKKKPVILY